MATGWGAYFASYVKKKEESPAGEGNSDESTPVSVVTKKPATTVQRFPTKKLYGNTEVPAPGEQPQRSNSNAARVAKMFGYAASAQAKLDRGAAEGNQEVQSVTSRPNPPTGPVSIDNIKLVPIGSALPKIPEAKVEQKTEMKPAPVMPPSHKPSVSMDNIPRLTTNQKAPRPDQPVRSQTDRMGRGKASVSKLDDLMLSLEMGSPATSDPRSPEKKRVSRKGKPSISQLDDLMSSMMEAPAPKVQERARSPKKSKPSISELDALMSMMETDMTPNAAGPASRKDSDQSYTSSRPKITTNNTQGLNTKLKILSPMTFVAPAKPWLGNSIVGEPASMMVPITLVAEPTGRIRSVSIPSPTTRRENGEEEKKTGPTILEYQQMSEQIKREQEQMESERKRMMEEEEAFEKEEKSFAEADEMMKQFVAEVEREDIRLREAEEKELREKELRESEQFDDESDYGDSEVDRDSFDRRDDDRLARAEADYQNSQVRIYEEEVEAERLRYDEEEDNARLEAERIEDDRLSKERAYAEEEERLERLRYEEEDRMEERRAEEERMAWRARREEKERERLRLEDEARMEDERLQEESRLEDERLEDERLAMEEKQAAKERIERRRFEEEGRRREAERLENEREREEQERAEFEMQERLIYEDEQRMEDARNAEERRMEEQREEQFRFEEARRIEDARIAIAEKRRIEEEREEQILYEEAQRKENARIAEERTAQQNRMDQEAAMLLAQEEEESEDEVLDKEAELRKAEEKIRAAFAGLAKERGQPALDIPMPPPKAFPVKPILRDLKAAKVGLGVEVTKAEMGVSRNNTVGGVAGRPLVPEKSPGVSRFNTVGGRTGLPMGGPRGGGLPSGPRAGLPSGPRPRRPIVQDI